MKSELKKIGEAAMTCEKEYFISLLSCFLNNTQPDLQKVDWSTIYNMAAVNNVAGIIGSIIKKLPPDYGPDGKYKSYFNQQIGKTFQEYEKRKAAATEFKKFLDENQIDYIIVKGDASGEYYPDRHLRTCGDVDVILRNDKFDAYAELIGKSFTVTDDVYNTKTYRVNGVNFEVHRTADIGFPYFDDIFSLAEPAYGSEFKLSASNHLLYIICHMLKHLSYRGAGVRMLLDTDVLFRSLTPQEENEFYDICKKAGVYESAGILLSLCSIWFKTPYQYALPLNKKTLFMFERVMIDGGVFGFEENTLGSYYISQSGSSKTKAVLRAIFPQKAYVRQYYQYSQKHKFLIPLAYANRIFDGVFKRTKHSFKTAAQIIDDDNEVAVIRSELMNMLNKDKQRK